MVRVGCVALALIVLSILLAPFAHALENENLLVTMPPGYKVGFHKRNTAQLITEMVPAGETVESWTEMVTVQIFFGHPASARQMQDSVADGWLKACPEGLRVPIADGVEKGYPASVWQLSCPRNAATGKPEWTWFKALRGKDSLYVVQKAFRFDPSKEQITTWVRYLKGVSVCDTRLSDRVCPKGIK